MAECLSGHAKVWPGLLFILLSRHNILYSKSSLPKLLYWIFRAVKPKCLATCSLSSKYSPASAHKAPIFSVGEILKWHSELRSLAIITQRTSDFPFDELARIGSGNGLTLLLWLGWVYLARCQMYIAHNLAGCQEAGATLNFIIIKQHSSYTYIVKTLTREANQCAWIAVNDSADPSAIPEGEIVRLAVFFVWVCRFFRIK